ncbi:hypothetical protein B0F89_11093 [Malaciobacter marinus]|uniref:Uncharacterized protein n=1 Tax=Malaciobacter marinus TaxID=505249 RepID=A0AB36ZVM0_9BACT|nr:ABC-three component system middle component 6 [Malaciobacter marinus]PPK61447.1 hypothetical protein B0F89_11093 [Malaciobacter marinus]SKB78939.1 hypothetical protein SAMN06295997_14417 [Malaciobacter marinus]
MIMGDKIVKVEDAFITMGGYILSLLKDKNMSIDLLYSSFLKEYPKKVNFDDFIYTIDFLYMIKKIKIRNDDILEVVI